MISSSNVTAAKRWNCLPGYMTMQNTDIKKDLRCSRSDGLMVIAFYQQVLTYSHPQRKVTVNVLMDTWFTTDSMIKSVLETRIDVIGIFKQLKQRYIYNGRQYELPGLRKFVDFSGARNTFGSLNVTTKGGIPIKIAFVRNHNKKSECLFLLSTDGTLLDEEIVRIYGNCWSIECFLKHQNLS